MTTEKLKQPSAAVDAGLKKTECPECGHTYRHYPNWFGKICVRCHAEIPAECEHPWVKANRERREAGVRKVLLSILRGKGSPNNAN
jgi:hypothetical protein